jgi:hypothetical protein
MFRFAIFLFAVMLLSACAAATPSPTPSPSADPYAPQPGDSELQRSEFYLDEQATNILTMESFPLQFALNLEGELPTPCHQPRIVVNPPDAGNKIMVEAYTVIDPDVICMQVIEEFAANIHLGSFPEGHYTLWVNEIMIGEFDA